MTNVTWGLTAKKPGSAQCPTLVINYGTTLLYQTTVNVATTVGVILTFNGNGAAI